MSEDPVAVFTTAPLMHTPCLLSPPAKRTSPAVGPSSSDWLAVKEAFQHEQMREEYEKQHAEDIADRPFRIPHEVMDVILASPDLGMREHLALAATCPALRRICSNHDAFADVVHCHTVPENDISRYLYAAYGPRDGRALRHLATRPRVPGPSATPLAGPCATHQTVVRDIRKHL